MADRAVFLDRDNTIMEDPGYVSDPAAVKLLPGVELALKGLSQEGYKVVVVTNQSGIARGLLTEEALERIHAELRRQLAEHSVHVDAICYCPYHPEGTVEQYAKDSPLRKPQPGMLLKAAEDMGLDLSKSWMVGDSGRDIEAGQRAGCRTIRIRLPGRLGAGPGQAADEDVQGDYSARNLVEAARLIIRVDSTRPGDKPAAPQRRQEAEPASLEAPAADKTGPSAMELAAVAAQVLSVVALVAGLWNLFSGTASTQAVFWALAALTLQVMALTFFVTHRSK